MRRLFLNSIAILSITQVYAQKLETGEKIEHVEQKYTLQSFNKKESDTAIAIYDRVILADGAIENDCGKPVCNIRIKFLSNLPEINIEAYNIYIDTTYDINNDGINELLIYHWWLQNSWTTISVYSLINDKWTELQNTQAFVVEDKDFKNRVLKKGNKFYLIGDSWNKDYSETNKSKKVIKPR